MRYLVIIVIVILLGSTIYVFKDSIFQIDDISFDDNEAIDEITYDYIHPCDRSTNLGNITKIVAESANSVPSPIKKLLTYNL